MLLTPGEPAPGPLPGPLPGLDRGSRPLRVVLADDAVLVREGLVRLLAEGGHQVVGGRLTVISPDGGPATVAAELPCC